MCRALAANCSKYSASFPNAVRASEAQRSQAGSSSSASRTIRVPRPPPPATALIISAPPAGSAAKNSRACSSVAGSALPASTGTPASAAASRARTLSPNKSSKCGVGPTNAIPASPHARANAPLSARNP